METTFTCTSNHSPTQALSQQKGTCGDSFASCMESRWNVSSYFVRYSQILLHELHCCADWPPKQDEKREQLLRMLPFTKGLAWISIKRWLFKYVIINSNSIVCGQVTLIFGIVRPFIRSLDCGFRRIEQILSSLGNANHLKSFELIGKTCISSESVCLPRTT